MVDYDSAVAPYRQVAAILRQRIESGQYAPGRRLPSVSDLVQEFGVARTTAAKTLRLLVAEGLAELSPGMGYYVTSSALVQPASCSPFMRAHFAHWGPSAVFRYMGWPSSSYPLKSIWTLPSIK
jgi:GntR family transcriptional regulator